MPPFFEKLRNSVLLIPFPCYNLSLATPVDNLREILIAPKGVAVAFSGGMDSGFLSLAAVRFRGMETVKAFFVASELNPEKEAKRAAALANRNGIPFSRLDLSVLQLAVFKEHPPDRCYHCKKEVFTRILALLPHDWILADGSNLDDRSDYRPGKRALVELAVRSPLDSAGFTKAMIRETLTEWGAEEFIRPPMPCLATRIPFGTPIKAEMLQQIAEGEEILRNAGLVAVRLRHHGVIARIEVPSEELDRALPIVRNAAKALKELGFRFITVDVEGYRQGSMIP